MDCIILAGNRENYREVCDRDNKAFLKIGGRPIISIILEELKDLQEIDRFLVVGPKDALISELDTFLETFPKPVVIFEQKNDLVSNITTVVIESGSDPNREVLIIPSDIPLLTKEELQEFMSMCDMDNYDYIGGVTTGDVLSMFYPTETLPGVEMAYVYFEGTPVRINNLHMVRPGTVKNVDYFRKVYSFRYQKKFRNMVAIILHLFLLLFKVPTAPVFYVMLHFSIVLRNRNKVSWAKKLESFLTLKTIAGYFSKILGTRVKIVTTSYGGSTIDVDNDKDFYTISARYDEWMEKQRNLTQTPN